MRCNSRLFESFRIASHRFASTHIDSLRIKAIRSDARLLSFAEISRRRRLLSVPRSVAKTLRIEPELEARALKVMEEVRRTRLAGVEMKEAAMLRWFFLRGVEVVEREIALAATKPVK